MKKIFLSLLLSLVGYLAYAQPANNTCANAITAPQNGTCVNGTTVAATDTWTGQVGCQVGGGAHPEVWYTFVATGSQAQFTVTNGTMTGNVELILVQGTCAGGFTLAGNECAASPLNIDPS